MRIRAALVETPGGPFTLYEAELEEPRADEILVRTTAAGICHTDLAMRQVWPPGRLPMVFGHEGTGIVEAVGDAVTTLVPGDTVCLTYRSCRACEQCSAGEPAYCEHSALLNAAGTRPDGSTPLSRTDGTPVHGSFFGQSAFASHCLTTESNTVKVPADLPAALVAPLGCSVQTGVGTVRTVLRPAAGTTLAVFGAGSVGLSAVMAAVAADCPVVAVEPLAARRALAKELGATAVIDPAGDEVVPALRDLTGGGPHCAMDTTGRPAVVSQAVQALRRRGTLALVGIGTAEFDTLPVLTKGLTIRGVTEGDAVPAVAVPELIGLYRQGRLPLEKLVTEFRFADIEAAAEAALTGRVVKPVLTMD
ncbi:NAD(P)-dependent alcohol dehydrogenase [Streptomyces chrestomyceticus]|uniref:NAD(P)-dependent alcohol dehydrogenase n=1 Tax=Streptomyces chrestomyceticus TaxID=68185 RepID=UPI0019D0E119|nr:NAD(P)-dependent alcohol dehydrogenase [Streptomyces chrestomyceticus]